MIAAGATVAVLGAGSWGTALAFVLARNGFQVRLWGHQSEHVSALQQDRANNAFLPGFAFPDNITPVESLADALQGCLYVCVVVPSSAFVDTLTQIKPLLEPGAKLVWGTKGIDPASNRLLSDCALTMLPGTPLAVLSGASFAKEVAADLPSAVTIASEDAEWLEGCIDLFAAPHFRIYPSHDMIGSQVCGVVKNVLAIAAGISDGMELGYNARCALITRGLAEMARLVVALGGDKDTVMGLCGLGDLVLTCTGDLSRNRRFGLALGRGQSTQSAVEEIGQAIEGMDNALQVQRLIEACDIDMPISHGVYQIIHEDMDPREALNQLIEREPKY